MVIYKYLLNYESEQTIWLPANADVLCCQVQNRQLYIWAIVEPTDKRESWTFYVRGTGQEFDPPKPKYLNTVQVDQYVWHIFYKKLE